VTGLLSQKAVYNDAVSVGEVTRSCLNKPSTHKTKTCTALGAGTRVDFSKPFLWHTESLKWQSFENNTQPDCTVHKVSMYIKCDCT